MKRLILVLVLVLVAACTPERNEGGTPIPGQQSGAPLFDEAVGPSEQQEEIEP